MCITKSLTIVCDASQTTKPGSEGNTLSLLQRRRRLVAKLQVNKDNRIKVGGPVSAEEFAAATETTICKGIDEKYEQIMPFAVGGHGTVYKAVHRDSGKKVALKVVRASDEEMVAFSRAEFAMMQRIGAHPNIVGAVDFFVCGHRTVLATSFFEGEQLGLAVANTAEKRLCEEVACRMFQALLEALDHLHSQRIVHRDVKPENVLVNSDFTHLQLIDFDIARYLPDGGALTPRCTPAYCAPEVRDGGSPSEAADIWGAGLCLLLMLTGKCTELIKEDRVAISACNASEECSSVLRSCLSMQYAMRPAAMSLLKNAWVNDTFVDEEVLVTYTGITSSKLIGASYGRRVQARLARRRSSSEGAEPRLSPSCRSAYESDSESSVSSPLLPRRTKHSTSIIEPRHFRRRSRERSK